MKKAFYSIVFGVICLTSCKKGCVECPVYFNGAVSKTQVCKDSYIPSNYNNMSWETFKNYYLNGNYGCKEI